MKTSEAIDTLARLVLLHGICAVEWEDYPDIGEDDWERIMDRAGEMIKEPSAQEFTKAYAHLSTRAKDAEVTVTASAWKERREP